MGRSIMAAAVSLDGFIARDDDSVSGQDHGLALDLALLQLTVGGGSRAAA
jgi:hypothetical protein